MTLDPLEWSASVQTNLCGTFFTLRAFHDLLLKHEAPRAKIICLSGGGSATPRTNFTPYAAAKAGVVRLVETLAREWAGQSIDINAVAPGPINTRMTDEVVRLGPKIVGDREFVVATEQQRSGGAPLPRVAAMVDLLFSRDGDGITGRLISTPWDAWEKLPAHREELAGSDIFTLRRIVPEDRGKNWR
jgi:3-oxoacyl-[acyl-carrier protein] reductase